MSIVLPPFSLDFVSASRHEAAFWDKIVGADQGATTMYGSSWLVIGWLLAAGVGNLAQAADVLPATTIALTPEARGRCLEILRAGLKSGEFWPSIHAAEALTRAGQGAEVRTALLPLLATEKDDQRRCGVARELARAGDRDQVQVLFNILKSADPHGHTHAAESLFKLAEAGDGVLLRQIFAESKDASLQLFVAGALAQQGDAKALAFIRGKLTGADVAPRRLAVWSLAWVGNASDLPALRKNAKTEQDAVALVYAQAALAILGDAPAGEALARSLQDARPEIRTPAAEFAGHARVVSSAGALQTMLEDKVLDARIRAAQALLMLSAEPVVLKRASSDSK